jgi:hypothetical protein
VACWALGAPTSSMAWHCQWTFISLTQKLSETFLRRSFSQAERPCATCAAPFTSSSACCSLITPSLLFAAQACLPSSSPRLFHAQLRPAFPLQFVPFRAAMTALPPVSADDMIDKVKDLPLEVRRSNDLLRVLDAQWVRRRARLVKAQDAYLRDLNARVAKLPRDGAVDLRKATEDAEAYAQIMALRESLQQLSEEKCSVAQQAHDSVATALEKLSTDLRRFEQELRVNGDWKEEVRGG